MFFDFSQAVWHHDKGRSSLVFRPFLYGDIGMEQKSLKKNSYKIILYSTAFLGIAVFLFFLPVKNVSLKELSQEVSSRLKGKKIIFSLLGAPGSGKGTLFKDFKKIISCKSFSPGSIFRKEIAKNTSMGNKIKSLVSSGKLISDEQMNNFFANWFEKNALSENIIFLDGYPRTKNQASFLTRLLKENSSSQYDFACIAFDISKDEFTKRISDRLTCENKKCQASFSANAKPSKITGICDLCQGKLVQREDDRPEKAMPRFYTTQNIIHELSNFYKEKKQKMIILTMQDQDTPFQVQNFNTFLDSLLVNFP